MDHRLVVRALAEIAETAAETLELQEVFGRVAASVRQVIPADHMGLVRMVDADTAVLHATTVCEAECVVTDAEHLPLTLWSPRIRPRPGPIPPVEDSHQELDPAFDVDRHILEGGTRSSIWQPFGQAGDFRGGVWVSSDQPRAFTADHVETLHAIARLLDSAVEHWRLWDAERRRRQRLDRLETVLREPVAAALDIREVFQAISQAVQEVLPHDALVLSRLLDRDDGDTVELVAKAGVTDVPVPAGPLRLSPDEVARRELPYEVIADVRSELEPVTPRNRLLAASGMRSMLRMPFTIGGQYQGSLVLLHREPRAFSEEDLEVARRLADRCALALSHQARAEESRIAAEERSRAARLELTVQNLTRELAGRQQYRVVGSSTAWRAVLEQVSRVAGVDTTVLVTGESGTGKEIVSHLIHESSQRESGPFVALNCAALPEQLLESELFGHERGAFTGAASAKAGRIEQARGGTLFLDEIGEMSPLVQAKLLRVLQEREFQRLGSNRTLHADVRVIAATNVDLRAAIERGAFREDLYYRLAVFEIPVPPLRERPEDVLELAETFLTDLGQALGRPAAGISRDARDWLLSYPWPGNIRELRNAIERALLLCDGGLITRAHLPAAAQLRPEAVRANASGMALPPGGVALEDVERGLVEQALEQSGGNKSKASQLLGLSRSQLYSRLDKYGLR